MRIDGPSGNEYIRRLQTEVANLDRAWSKASLAGNLKKCQALRIKHHKIVDKLQCLIKLPAGSRGKYYK